MFGPRKIWQPCSQSFWSCCFPEKQSRGMMKMQKEILLLGRGRGAKNDRKETLEKMLPHEKNSFSTQSKQSLWAVQIYKIKKRKFGTCMQ
jgi:hypothetical protein